MKENTLYRWLYFFTILNAIYVFISIFTGGKAVGDDFEHLHAAWLVWLGYIPYNDFFEHHNPLLWYVFAPLVGICGRNVTVFFLVRFIVMAISLLTLYVVYRTVKDFLADKLSALLAVNIFCLGNTALNTLVLFKPDAFMQLCFFGGLYFFFAYLRNKKRSRLIISAILFTVGFLFLQTIIFLLLPVALSACVLLCRKEILRKDAVLAAAMPCVIILGAVIFLYLEGNWQRYYELNWVVNGKIAESARERVVNFGDFYFVLALGFLSSVYLLRRKNNKYVIIWFALYAVEFLLRAFYFSVGLYYFKILLLCNAVMLAMGVADVYRFKKYTAYVVCLVFVVFGGKFWLFEDFGKVNVLTVVGIADDIAKNSKASDVVLGTTSIPFGIFNANPHYYWFSWSWVGKIDEELFHYKQPFDINGIIAEKRPEFIYFEEDLKSDYKPETQYDIQPELLNSAYKKAKYSTLYQLVK